MPIDGIGNNYNSYSGYATSHGSKPSSSSLARNIEGARQSEYGFRRGHQRSNAVDFRISTSITSVSTVSKNSTSLVDKLGSGATIKP